MFLDCQKYKKVIDVNHLPCWVDSDNVTYLAENMGTNMIIAGQRQKWKG